MKIAVGSDKKGLEILQDIKNYVAEQGYEVVDYSCDGNDYITAVADAVSTGEADKGILFDRTGALSGLVANKTPNIRAAQVSEYYSARLTAAHNAANVLCMGSEMIGKDTAMSCVKIWLATGLMEGNHARRIGMLHDNEKEFLK